VRSQTRHPVRTPASATRRPRTGASAVFPVPRQRLAIIGSSADTQIVRSVRRAADRLGWPHLLITDPSEVSWAVTVNKPALVVVTGGNGPRRVTLDTITALRRSYAGPLVLVDNASSAAVVSSLVAGADSVLPADLREDELGARLLAFARRSAEGSASGARFLSAGPLEVDLWRKEAFLSGRALGLSSTEFRLLVCLMESAGQVVPLRRILHRVWGWADADLNTLRIYITRLRKSLGECARSPRFITSVRGHGYMFTRPVTEAADREADVAHADLSMMQRLSAKCTELAAAADIPAAGARIAEGLVNEGTVDAVGLHLSDGDILRLIGHFGFTIEWEKMAREVALADHRFASAQSVLLAQPVQLLRRNFSAYPGTRAANSADTPGTFLFVPIVYRAAPIGTMGVVRHSDEPFGPLTVSYLQAVAALCGTCLGSRWEADHDIRYSGGGQSTRVATDSGDEIPRTGGRR